MGTLSNYVMKRRFFFNSNSLLHIQELLPKCSNCRNILSTLVCNFIGLSCCSFDAASARFILIMLVIFIFYVTLAMIHSCNIANLIQKRRKRKQSWHNLRHYPHIYIHGRTGYSHPNLVKDGQSLGRDLTRSSMNDKPSKLGAFFRFVLNFSSKVLNRYT